MSSTPLRHIIEVCDSRVEQPHPQLPWHSRSEEQVGNENGYR